MSTGEMPAARASLKRQHYRPNDWNAALCGIQHLANCKKKKYVKKKKKVANETACLIIW
jgi:hypothetical protein